MQTVIFLKSHPEFQFGSEASILRKLTTQQMQISIFLNIKIITTTTIIIIIRLSNTGKINYIHMGLAALVFSKLYPLILINSAICFLKLLWPTAYQGNLWLQQPFPASNLSNFLKENQEFHTSR